MKKLTHVFASFLIVVSAASVLVVASPQPAAAKCGEYLLTFPAWYRGLLVEPEDDSEDDPSSSDSCEIATPTQADGDEGISNFIWKIVLNVIDMLMQLVGYASVVFLIIGGFRYMTATGDPGRMTAAKTTVTNAIIGLIVALASVAIVSTIVGII